MDNINMFDSTGKTMEHFGLAGNESSMFLSLNHKGDGGRSVGTLHKVALFNQYLTETALDALLETVFPPLPPPPPENCRPVEPLRPYADAGHSWLQPFTAQTTLAPEMHLRLSSSWSVAFDFQRGRRRGAGHVPPVKWHALAAPPPPPPAPPAPRPLVAHYTIGAPVETDRPRLTAADWLQIDPTRVQRLFV